MEKKDQFSGSEINEKASSWPKLISIKNTYKEYVALAVLGLSLNGCNITKAYPKQLQKPYKLEKKDQGKDIQRLIEKAMMRKFDDPNKYLEYLNQEEVVIPNDIFNIYAKSVDDRLRGKPEWMVGMLEGGYIDYDRLSKEEEFFRISLEKKYSKTDIDLYFDLLSSGDLIVFPERAIKDFEFTKHLAHERMHKYFEEIPEKEKREVYNGVQKILEARDENGKFLIKEGINRINIQQNWGECFPYIMDGRFSLRVPFGKKGPVEKELMKYPEAYRIFSELKTKSEKEIKETRKKQHNPK